MKANRPSLILYFIALLATILFDVFNLEFLGIYAKAIVVPAMFFYYLASNNFIIGKTEGLVFMACFIGQVFDLMGEEISEMGSLVSFIVVYLFLLKMIVLDYDRIKIKKADLLPISIVVMFIVYLLISVLSLQFDKMNHYKVAYAIYGVILSILGIVTFVSYITKGTNITLVLSIMSVCFIASDLFYIFSQYFLDSGVLVLIKDICQVLSYYFMTRYFIIKENQRLLNDN